MASLAEIRQDAASLDVELTRAETVGSLPPSVDELREFCHHVQNAENDKCETCDEVENFALGFERCVDKDSVIEAGEALAQLLFATGMVGKIRDARTLVDRFAFLASEELKKAA